MNKEEILKKIANIEKAINDPKMSAGAKANMQRNVDSLKSDLEKIEKDANKEIKKVEDKVDDADAQIEKLEALLKKGNLPDAVRRVNEQKLATLKSKKNQIKSEIEKEKKEIKENPLKSEGAKEKIEKKVEKIEQSVAVVEKEANKEIKKTEEKVENIDDEIAKIEKLLSKSSLPDAVKKVNEKKLAALKERKSTMKKEIVEEKKEIKETVSEVKKAVKEVKTEVKKATKRGRPKKSASSPKIQSIKSKITDLERLVASVKALRDKYTGKRVNLERDAGRSAKPFGYRFKGKYDYRVPTPRQIELGKRRGTIDYEARPNRSDKYPKGYKGDIKEKLADGGKVKKKNKPGRKKQVYKWANDAVKDGVIKMDKINSTPSKYQIKKYPAYVVKVEKN